MSNETLQASNPEYCVRVTANAGTGKTHLLTARVLRILLSGVHPSKILCLTYTNAAAAEMIGRISEKLREWATITNQKLEEELSTLIGTQPTENQIKLARTIFSKTIESSPPPRIQTIHSFCQEVLKRFPLEAKIPPYFSIIDDIASREMIEDAKHIIITKKSPALEYFVNECGEHKFSETVKEIISRRGKLDGALPIPFPTQTKESVINEFFSSTPDFVKGTKLEAIYQNKDFDEVISAYITDGGKGTNKKNIIGAKPPEDLKQRLDYECERIRKAIDDIKTIATNEFSYHTFNLAQDFYTEYEKIKQLRAVIDYNDLIEITHNLLRSREATQWVLFKLDGGIDHILVDEAQDTSPKQWEIIEALSEEFFSGNTKAETNRTIFIVGDEKQSIYSFQGANPDKFYDITTRIKQRAIEAGKTWYDIPLKKSYRSVNAILQFVDKVFESEKLTNYISKSERQIEHKLHREGEGGVVKLYPLVSHDKKEDSKPWVMPNRYINFKNAEQKTAENIAKIIKDWIDSNRVLESTGKPVEYKDILILLRKRSNQANLIIRHLKKLSIPVSGADRLKITEHIVIKDLIALTNFCLLPSDDLSLACALKSPLFGISEDELFSLCYDRPASLFVNILNHAPELGEQLKQISNKADLLTIHEFYSYILDELGGRKKFVARLGEEVHDILDEFMDLCLEFEVSRQSSLQMLIKYLSNTQMEIKRDMENSTNQVRVMTIHASKGLQAPIVFIVDANSKIELQDNLFLDSELIGSKSSEDRNNRLKAIREQESNKIYAEYMRLLYVAITRAADELHIFGDEKKNNKGIGKSWFEIIEPAISSFADKSEDGTFTIRTPQTKELKKSEDSIPAEIQPNLPEYMSIKVANQQSVFEDISHQREKPDKAKTKRGKKIHKILEIISKTSNQEMVIKKLAEDERIIIERLLKDQKTARLFSAHTFSEMPIIGKIGEKTISAIIDKVVVSDDEVLVVDFKTSANPPKTVPEQYIEQLNSYAQLMRLKYPNKTIKAAILWTETGRFDEVSLTFGSADNIYNISKTA